ncbi:MAG: hypothetical protein JW989_08115 [Chlorobiaceae bacterium]|nr:hypothetical protein [Chlorobiaceae bacterium]
MGKILDFLEAIKRARKWGGFGEDYGLSGISEVHKKEHYPEFSEAIKKGQDQDKGVSEIVDKC